MIRLRDRNVITYLVYSSTPAVFHKSIQFLYLKSLGLDIPALFTLWGFGYLLNAFLEFPVGILSDRIPRKYILALSTFIFLLAQCFYLIVTKETSWLLYLSETFATFSTSLYSGTKSAILADDLKVKNRFQDFPILQTTSLFFMKVMTLLFISIGGWLYIRLEIAPYLANIFILIVGLFSILLFKESKFSVEDEEIGKKIIAPLVSDVQRIWMILLYSALVAAFFSLMGNLLQPYLDSVFHFNVKKQIITYLFYTFSGVVGAVVVVSWIKKRAMSKGMMPFVLVTSLLLLLLALPLQATFVIAIFMLLRFFDGIQNIFFLNELHHFGQRVTRATLLSIKSIVESLLKGLSHFAVAGVIGTGGPQEFRMMLLSVGIVYIVLLLPAPLLLKRFYQNLK